MQIKVNMICSKLTLLGDGVITIEKGNYASFNTNKQTSFRQSYTNSSNSGTFPHYNPPKTGAQGTFHEGVAVQNIQNYSSITNSSNKLSNRKDFYIFKATNSRSSSLSQAKSISRKKPSPRRGLKMGCLKIVRHDRQEDMEVDTDMKLVDMDVDVEIGCETNLDEKLKSKCNTINELFLLFVEVHKYSIYQLLTAIYLSLNFILGMDRLQEVLEPNLSEINLEKASDSNLMQIESAKPEKQMTDEEKLEYFHNVVKLEVKRNLQEEDKTTFEDPLECSEYVSEIFSHLKSTELEFIAQPGYMKRQPDINEKMRAILIDWLVEVHLKFKLYPETLYLTVNLIDRYLEKEEVMRQHLQLVGVTAMLIASKY
jgi:hypothetical protein